MERERARLALHAGASEDENHPGTRIEMNDGGGGIRTPGDFRHNGFQDRRIKPLCHPSTTILVATHVLTANCTIDVA